jgi:iron(III) transport system substrate-binding protein
MKQPLTTPPPTRRAACLTLLAGFLAGCQSDGREKLVVYSPHGKELLSAYEDAFESAHPDIDVQWIDMGGQDAYDRIRTERTNPQASIWWGGASVAFALAADDGLLEPYRPSWGAAVEPSSRDSLDRWYGTYLTPEVIAFNSTALTAEQAPRDWDELLDEKWKGRILIRYPLQSSTMRTIFGAMILRQPTVEQGFDWLARLDENVKTYTADPTQLYLRLARGEGDLTLWNLPDIHLQSDRNGYPFDYIYPASGTPVLTDGIAVVASAPNPDAARTFYEFVTSDTAVVDQAHRFYRIPVRTDIDRALLPEWMIIDEPVVMDVDWDRLARDGGEWMLRWDEEVKGRGIQ